MSKFAPLSVDRYAATEAFRRQLRKLRAPVRELVDIRLGELPGQLLPVATHHVRTVQNIDVYAFPIDGAHKISFHVIEEIKTVRGGHALVEIRKRVAMLRGVGTNAAVDANP
jgi:hypothetical protein